MQFPVYSAVVSMRPSSRLCFLIEAGGRLRYNIGNRPRWLLLQAPYLALVDEGKGLFSCQHKAAGFGRAGEVAVKVRHSNLKRPAVKACGLYRLPCGIPIVTSQPIHALNGYFLLDIVGDRLDLSSRKSI